MAGPRINATASPSIPDCNPKLQPQTATRITGVDEQQPGAASGERVVDAKACCNQTGPDRQALQRRLRRTHQLETAAATIANRFNCELQPSVTRMVTRSRCACWRHRRPPRPIAPSGARPRVARNPASERQIPVFLQTSFAVSGPSLCRFSEFVYVIAVHGSKRCQTHVTN